MIGVIGGMGPLATVDFLQKVIDATGAQDDQSHVPLLVSADPRIPSRPAAILHGAESPLPRLREIRDRLLDAGASALVMPCNTAHFWYPDLQDGCPVPFLSIVEAGCGEALARAGAGATVGVAATRATLASGLFDATLLRLGMVAQGPTDADLDAMWLPAIAAVKAGRIEEAAGLASRAVDAMLQRGATHVVLACTELPIALAATRYRDSAVCIDTTLALARATVAHWRLSAAGAAGINPPMPPRGAAGGRR